MAYIIGSKALKGTASSTADRFAPNRHDAMFIASHSINIFFVVVAAGMKYNNSRQCRTQTNALRALHRVVDIVIS